MQKRPSAPLKKRSTRYLVYAVLIHIGFVGLLLVSLEWSGMPTFTTPAPEKIVQAVVVDEKQVAKELKQIKQDEEKRRRAEEARQRKLEEDAKKAQQSRKDEEQRLVELKKKQQEESEKIQKQKEVEAEQLKELQQKKAAETKRLAELEIKRKADEEERALQEAKKRMDEELANETKALAAQQSQAVLSEVQKYTGLIQAQVSNNWVQPTNFESGSSCVVVVKLIPTGEVIDVTVKQCKGGALFQRSVESAVRKASPFPVSKDAEVFAKLRDIEFNFKPEISQ